MSHFGEALFEGSGCVRWAITPLLIVFSIAMPACLWMVAPWTMAAVVGIATLELPCLALLAALWLPQPLGRCACRAVTGFVFACYTIYLMDELFFAPPRPPQAPNSLSKAFKGFVVIGMPCLYFTIFGRFRAQTQPMTNLEYFEPPPDDEETSVPCDR